MRLFFALPLPSQVKERLRPILEGARQAGGDGVSFTKLEQLHFTLAFLGEQPDAAEASSAGEVLQQGRAFDLALSGVGAFPNTMRPRVLWLGVSTGAAELMETAERLRGELRRRGFQLEERKFQPHLTIGRVRPRGEKLAKQALAAVAPGEFARWPAGEASLVKSVLGRGGATHTVERAFPFARAL
jgi:RNA 2',3'-cyclic 3'-phosphodiesterase